MMAQMNGSRIVLIGCVLAMLSSGCGTTTDSKSGVDSVKPETLPGDFPLTERPEEGTRIADVDVGRIQFKYDSTQIMDSEMFKIEKAADYLRRNHRVRVVVEGHCDERGSNEYNMSLGEYRALAVRANLIRLGVGRNRLQTRSFGEEQPADPRHTESAWRQNRRAAFVFYR